MEESHRLGDFQNRRYEWIERFIPIQSDRMEQRYERRSIHIR